MGAYLISFDDTDNLETLGTGHLLARFLGTLSVETGYITRHQLFVDERVPFTSHNSAMCATVDGDIDVGELIARAGRFLERERSEGSDPGLCIADMQAVADAELLIEWGRRAKSEVLAKADAYDLAQRCGVHLSEHGGDGQGVVGALAAVGLRLSGNDGRVRGKAIIESVGTAQRMTGRTAQRTVQRTTQRTNKSTVQRMTVSELLERTGFDRVCGLGCGVLSSDCEIELDGNEVKAVYLDFSRTVLAMLTEEGGYRLMGKQQLKQY